MGILEFIVIAALLGFGAWCLILLSAMGLLHLDMQIPRIR